MSDEPINFISTLVYCVSQYAINICKEMERR